MDPVENRGRSKFFTCFKPAFDDDEPGLNIGSPPLSDSEDSVRRKKRLRRSFSKVMKAVFFKTSLGKKLGSKKSRQESFRSSSSSSYKNEKFVNSTKKSSSYKGFSEPPEEIFRTNSNNSSIFSPSVADSSRSSSRASSISSNSRSGSERVKQSASLDLNTISRQQAMKKEGDNCTVKCKYGGMSIFLVCLIALVFWGKVFAIATCTSTWLFFAPGRRYQSLRIVDESPESNIFDSEEYKKRVIMEGLLERNRPRVL